MNFEEYLQSKKIDSAALKIAEPVLWESWHKEFDQTHPASFTAQKLYLINPLRRKFQLSASVSLPLQSPSGNTPAVPTSSEPTSDTPKPAVKAPIAKPVLRPKPKMS